MHWPIGMKLEPKVPWITFTSVYLLVIQIDWIYCLLVYLSPQSRQESRRALISTIASIFSWICLFLGFIYLQEKGLNISTYGGHYHSSYWVCCRKSPSILFQIQISGAKSKLRMFKAFFYFSSVSRWWPFVFFSERRRQQFTILQENQFCCYHHKFYALMYDIFHTYDSVRSFVSAMVTHWFESVDQRLVYKCQLTHCCSILETLCE